MILLEAQGESGLVAEEEARALEQMPFVEPGYEREKINAAGKLIVRTWADDGSKWNDNEWDSYFDALRIVNNWRSAHGYPLNTFQTTLRINARRFDSEALIAQRMKRLVSIVAKLEREETMK
ncbi:MAG: hypothetical protein ACREFQ_23090, partial [Stellaceae bacterium]